MRLLVWFRRDFRVRDHSALFEASKAADEGVVGVFLVSTRQWKKHDDAAAKIDFWLRNLQRLRASLARFNIPLLIREASTYEEAPQVLERVVAETRSNGLYYNREYEINELRRDAAVEKRFAQRGHSVRIFDDRVMVAPGEVRTKYGHFYTVFSPFRQAWIKQFERTPPRIFPLPKKQLDTGFKSSSIPGAVTGFDFSLSRSDLWPPGEEVARRRLRQFVSKQIAAYKDHRDLPALNGTSLLSPYLAAGVLSPRQCFRATQSANDGKIDIGDPGATTWMSELIWREFYTHVLVGFQRVSKGRAFSKQYDAVDWRFDEGEYAAWRDGRTGYPIVDAAMRQLRQTGWMHNRLRMVAAMFLSKHLLIDWRHGERHFMRHLVDGDLAANNGGWQWSASTGTDAAPYFRIFNPYSQSRRFDPNGEFISRFCPELVDLPPKNLHDGSPSAQQARKRVGYPTPIVDHREARKRALKAFGVLKSNQK